METNKSQSNQTLSNQKSLEKMLLKDSNFFKQQTDETLQKQIIAGVEREATSTAKIKPLNIKKLSWWFSGLSTAAIAGFLTITLLPQILVTDDNTQIAPQILAQLDIQKIGENIETLETASISKMTTEKEALQKDIQSIIDAFKVSKNNA